MNILFVNYGDFTTASLNHIRVFADLLCASGHDCLVAVPAGMESVSVIAGPRFRTGLFDEILGRPGCFGDGRTADILHAWTPRECVRKFVLEYQNAIPEPARLVLHLEDNEEHLISTYAGKSLAELRTLSAAQLDRIVHPYLPHPVYFQSFPFFADAITHLTGPLREFAPTAIRTQLLPPALDPAYLRSPVSDPGLRIRLGVRPDEKVIVYTGSNTFANEPEIRELYAAVGLLNARGTPTRLIRTGIIPPDFLSGMEPAIQSQVTELGFVAKTLLPSLLALADVLVQPGRAGPFDDYRLPSKLPEFLASGRPVVLPESNIAHLLRDGEEAMFLRDGNASDIAERCETVFNDPALGARLGVAGAAFARRYFDPQLRTQELLGLYTALLAQPPRAFWRKHAPDRMTALTATAGILADAVCPAEGAGPPREELASLAADLVCLTRFSDEECDLLRSDNARLRQEVSGGVEKVESLTVQLRAMAEARDHFQHTTEQLAAEEQRVQRELTLAWSEHAAASARVAELHREVIDREEQLRVLKMSLSWRITAGLRALPKRLTR